MLWSDFQKPKKLDYDPETLTPNYGRFIAQPFERGFGTTIGNALRRVLLSSIEGAAITAVRVEGVLHEFSSLQGVVEDMTDVVLNLKQVPFKLHGEGPKTMYLEKKGPGVVTAADFDQDADIEILDPTAHIATLSKEGTLKLEARLRRGRGYQVADRNADTDLPLGYIPIDSIHSPVRRVNYHVEGARVGQMTDYDKLVLEVWTDGRITPDDALKQSASILKHHLDVFDRVSQENYEFESQAAEVSEEQNKLRKLLNMSVNEIELSVRAANCLNNANITTVGELAMKTEQEMLKYRNFGKKSLNEIKEKLEALGLSLGMKFDERLLETKKEA
jgi:DNA-directed RNA polymerase subunit alpha